MVAGRIERTVVSVPMGFFVGIKAGSIGFDRMS